MKNSIAILKRALENVQSEHAYKISELRGLEETAKAVHAELDHMEKQMKDLKESIQELEGKYEQVAPKTKKAKR
jgi:phage shock protein A